MRLWLELTGRIERTVPAHVAEAAEWGKRLEPLIREAVEMQGFKVYDAPEEVADEARPWLLGHPDGLTAAGFGPRAERIIDGETITGGRGVLELKTASVYYADEWEAGIPDHYQLQGQHYMHLTGLSWALFACLIGGQKLVLRELERDQDLIDFMVAAEEQFWGYVERDEQPPPDGSEETTGLLRQRFPRATHESVELAPDDRHLYRDLLAARHSQEMAEREAERLKQEIMQRMGEASYLTLDGVPVITWKGSTTARVDVNAVRRLYPKVAEECTVKSESRRFLVK